MRPKEAAIRATEKAIALSAKYNTPLYILHMSTMEELELVRAAKKKISEKKKIGLILLDAYCRIR